MKKERSKTAGGFTLIELMIVVGIIGILAAVAIPQYGNMIEKSNNGATLGNLAAIRSAITMYYSSYAIVPYALDVSTPGGFSELMGSTMPGVKARYPLLHSPYGNNITTGTLIPSTSGTGWYYNNASGYIYINSIEKDVYNMNYTMY
jgi:prepilin-type N-terminal cleavage/methylation domain-containing protein